MQLDPSAGIGSSKIRLRSDLDFCPESVRHDGSIVIEDRLRGRFFEIGPEEHRIICHFDGCKTVAGIAGSATAAAGNSVDVHFRRIAEIAQWLVQNNLAIVEGTDCSSRLQAQRRKVDNQRVMSWLNILCLKITLMNPSGLLKQFGGLEKYVFNPVAATGWCLLAVFAGSILVTRWSEFAASYAGVLSGFRWIWLLLVWVMLKMIHEAGHALACHRYGGRVNEAGVLLLLFTPMAWVDVSACWKLKSRWQRIVITSAGMYFELAIAFAAIVAWSVLPTGSTWRDICFNTVLMASVTTILFNANPLMRFDGYFILVDVIGIVNLYTKGQNWTRGAFRQLLFGWKPQQLTDRHTLAAWAVPAYGIMAMFWRVVIGFSLIIGASVMFHGAGIVLGLIALVTWYGVPAFHSMMDIRQQAGMNPVNRRRFSAVILSAALFGLLAGLVLQSPARKSAPAVVRLKGENILRAVHDGFVKSVLVNDGQLVKSGERLVALECDELPMKVRKLELEILACESKVRTLLDQKKLAAWQAETENLANLRSQLRENVLTREAMTIRAPFDGVVYCRNIDSLEGRYMRRGDTVLTVAKSNSREIVASIDQENSSAIELVSDQMIKAVFPGIPVKLCSVSSINPRADTRPLHPALCVPAGGPLAVRPTARTGSPNENQAELELVAPRINIELQLPDGVDKQVFPGQTGHIIFASQKHSLGVWGWLSLTDWVRKKIRLATGAPL